MMTARHPSIVVPTIAVLGFLAYAITFLYFFVDDEAIGFVYAQNLLRGRGLTYSVFEGPTEGYSNFLHVGIDALILSITILLGLPKIAVFPIGKAVSLAAGAATVASVAWAARRLLPNQWLSRIGPLGFLALAGPLAVWSCSSLETVPFVAAFTGFVVALLVGSPRSLRVATLLGAAVILFRIDGFVFVGAVAAAAWIVGPSTRRSAVIKTAVPFVLLFVVYHAWRWWYFGSILSLPLQTKVLFKLLPADGVVTRLPDSSYLERFLDHYQAWPLTLLAVGWLPFWQWGDDRRPAIVALSLAALVAYVSVIGDWMFGFRFFVALFPLVAIAGAFSLASMERRSKVVAVTATVALLAWSGWTAQRFVVAFGKADRLARWQPWWSERSFETARFFAPYYPMYEDMKDRIPAGASMINNQAGLLPFLLDVDNVDDLGITTRFFAALPTADVIFTEVGRYHPLTDRPPLVAGETYLAHRDITYLVTWRHLIAGANRGAVPAELLGGHYRLADESEFQLLYERVRPPAVADHDDFHESLSHPATVRRVVARGSEVARAALRDELPFLAGEGSRHSLREPLHLELHLPGDAVHALWIDGIKADEAFDATLMLHDARGNLRFREVLTLEPDRWHRYHQRFEDPVAGGVFTLQVAARSGSAGTVELKDLRVLGQSADLREHVEAELRRP